MVNLVPLLGLSLLKWEASACWPCPWLPEPWVSTHIHGFLSISPRSIWWTSYNLTPLKPHECISFSENYHEKLGYPPITNSLQFPSKSPRQTGVFVHVKLGFSPRLFFDFYFCSWSYYIPLYNACFIYCMFTIFHYILHILGTRQQI